jgi:predicted O-methyltransferase YrrM
MAESAVLDFLRPSATWQPKHFRPSTWSEHVPFAFWLIDVLRPRRLVELGTWKGMSYLGFCQAIQQLATGTTAFAVDTWQGDAHTGFMRRGALESLKQVHDPNYSEFSTLVRATFDEALTRFEDASIDLLHIDGLHTYEAVRHDFETWSPKLTNPAVVLFHDTQVVHPGYGVRQYWGEISARYPHFEFHHEHGLGVLGIGAGLPTALEGLFAATNDPEKAQFARNLFARLGRAVRGEQLQASKGVRTYLKLLGFGARLKHMLG